MTKQEACIKAGLLTKDNKVIPGVCFDYAIPQNFIDRLEDITRHYLVSSFVWLYDKKSPVFGRPFGLNPAAWGYLAIYDYNTGSIFSAEEMRTIESNLK